MRIRSVFFGYLAIILNSSITHDHHSFVVIQNRQIFVIFSENQTWEFIVDVLFFIEVRWIDVIPVIILGDKFGVFIG